MPREERAHLWACQPQEMKQLAQAHPPRRASQPNSLSGRRSLAWKTDRSMQRGRRSLTLAFSCVRLSSWLRRRALKWRWIRRAAPLRVRFRRQTARNAARERSMLADRCCSFTSSPFIVCRDSCTQAQHSSLLSPCCVYWLLTYPHKHHRNCVNYPSPRK